MRSTVCRIEDISMLRLFRLSREVAHTSVWMGLATVITLFWATGTFERGAQRTVYARAATPLMTATAAPAPPKIPRVAGGQVGLQLYSLRHEFKAEGARATLKRIRAMGFRFVEGGGSYDLTPQEFKAELARNGLQMVSIMAGYDKIRDHIGDVIADAKFYGASYVGTAWISHQPPFNEIKTREAAQVFNTAGAACKAAGLKFFYHLHGYEFQPSADGTLFDLLVKETRPALVNFELDVFWATHGGQDAAALLRKYPKRFLLTHLKDLRQGVTGNLTGSAPDETSVVLGTGQVKWPEVFQAAKQAGIKWHFIEAEEPTAAANIPKSLDYLRANKF